MGQESTDQEITNNDYCSCVMTARKVSDIQPSWVPFAFMIPVVSKIPTPNAWILFKATSTYSILGHTGVVMTVGTNTLKIIEGNFKHCQMTIREVKINDPLIRGYFK